MLDNTKKIIKFSCNNLWKLFGQDCYNFLHNNNFQPTDEDFKKANIIPAVQNANLKILEGEIFVIMGLSGSGKSTLIRCLSRLTESTFGEIYFENSDLIKMSYKELINLRRHKMGMVFQNFALLPHMTVLGNVLFPLEIQGMKKQEMNKIALRVLELVGLKGRENYFPKELSGGQQQRVGIARSLAVDPEVWFLDEPFSALDPLIRRDMQNEFLRIQDLLHKTIIFITHDFDEAIKLADRIIIMNEGRIVQIGSPEDLIMKPADNYVKEFTEDLPRERLLSVRSIMNNTIDLTNSTTVYEDEKIFKILEKVLSKGSVSVVNKSNEVVGSLNKEIISKFIYN